MSKALVKCFSGKSVECHCNLQINMSNNLYRAPWKCHCYEAEVQLGYGEARPNWPSLFKHCEIACSRETGTLQVPEVQLLRRGQQA